jgi:hypothetical protein
MDAHSEPRVVTGRTPLVVSPSTGSTAGASVCYGHRPMARSRFNAPITPMDLANMRENGVRSLAVSCWICQHRAVLNVDHLPDNVTVPSFGPRMVCTRCGIIGADARPNWQEQPLRECLTGVQWRT